MARSFLVEKNRKKNQKNLSDPPFDSENSNSLSLRRLLRPTGPRALAIELHEKWETLPRICHLFVRSFVRRPIIYSFAVAGAHVWTPSQALSEYYIALKAMAALRITHVLTCFRAKKRLRISLAWRVASVLVLLCVVILLSWNRTERFEFTIATLVRGTE